MIEGMAWDFSTDPEFQRQLDWMRALVREEVWPLETISDELDYAGFKRAIKPATKTLSSRFAALCGS